MSPEDKKRLSDAFREAVLSSPDADTPFELGGKDTPRRAMERYLVDERFYEAVEKAGGVDVFIEKLKNPSPQCSIKSKRR